MIQEKKRIRSARRYHYRTIEICDETDVLFTRCRVCKELYPSTLEYFKKETHKDAKRTIEPLCRKCACKQQREYIAEKIQKEKEQKEKDQKKKVCLENSVQATLFDEADSVETKLDKILSFLGLNNKGTFKK